MKIANEHLERHFQLTEGKFYTRTLLSKKNDYLVEPANHEEFRLVFCDGSSYLSSDFDAHIVEERPQSILVHFSREDVTLNILYQAREDVLAKEVVIYSSHKRINYIDVELIDFGDQEALHYPKKQADIKEMAGFSGYYVELGQPVYAKSFFFGMEFPMGENRLTDQSYFSRYYLGHDVNEAKKIWPVIVGAADETDKASLQKAFFAYISGIAQPSYFRKQYNSWYDHMTAIDEEIILKSFAEIYHGFEDYGIHLDAYVVDDGWCDYQSVWEFNDKFPNELSKVKELVNQLGSSLGLWIGPRGGYNGTEKIMSDWLAEHPEFGSQNQLSRDVNVGDMTYLNLMKEKMLQYQKAYDISYWKIDGWLLKPDVADCSGDYGMHTMTPIYEFLIELLTDLRAERGERDCWLNLTSYVNPSPWFLQWVNSLWIQISQDVGFAPEAGSDMQRMITYRDCQYQEFLKERDIQLPLWALYNHEPIYASAAHTWYLDTPMFATVEEFEDYLMFIATRGNAFWEFHYSYSMFDDERWQANARAIKWIDGHYETLKHSRMIGGNPKNFDIYGYSCKNPQTGQEILSLRNPSNEEQTIQLADLDLAAYKLVKQFGKWQSINDIISLSAYGMVILERS